MAKAKLAAATFGLGLALFSAESLLRDATGAASEASYLNQFDGRWTGSGTLRSALLGAVPLQCDVSGQARGETLEIRGQCSASGISRRVHADVRYDRDAKTYRGTWSDGSEGSRLAGSRRGDVLSLAALRSGKSETRRVVLVPEGERFRFSLAKQDGGSEPVMNIAFRRG